MVSISGTLTIRILDGPQVSVPYQLQVDAYDKIDIELPATNPSSATVDIQPGDQAQFLLISSNLYDAGLTYEVDSSGNSNALDGPLFLVGEGAVSLLGATQQQFEFTNTTGEPVSISILVGRNAVS